MVFFLAETDENPSVVKYCVLSGFLLVLIAFTVIFFVFKFKKKEEKTQIPSKTLGHKSAENSKTEKEENQETNGSTPNVKADVQTENKPAEKPKTEGKGQGGNDLNSGADSKTSNAPEPNKDFPVKKEEVLNPEQSKEESLKHNNSESTVKEQTPEGSVPVENTQPKKKEEQEVNGLSSDRESKTINAGEANKDSLANSLVNSLANSLAKKEEKPEVSGGSPAEGVPPICKSPEEKPKRVDSPVEKEKVPEKKNSEHEENLPTAKTETPKPGPDEKKEPPAEKKELSSNKDKPQETAESVKKKEEDPIIFKEIKEALEKFQPKLSKKTKKEIQQNFQSVVSVLIERKYTLQNINMNIEKSNEIYTISAKLLDEGKKKSFCLDLKISRNPSVVIFGLKGNGQLSEFTYISYDSSKAKTRKEKQDVFKTIFEKKLTEIERDYNNFLRVETLYLYTLNEFLTKELDKVRMPTEKSEKSQEIFVDLDKNKAALEETGKEITRHFFNNFPLTETVLQTKELKITAKEYHVPLLSQKRPFMNICFELKWGKQKISVIAYLGYLNQVPHVSISTNGRQTQNVLKLNAPLIFDTKPESLISSQGDKT